jgi:diacylglycerol kinase family enzyme
VSSIEPVGILNAWTRKVRIRMNRTNATAIDFVHSQTTRANDGEAGARRGDTYFVDVVFAGLFAKIVLLVDGARRRAREW